MLTEKNGELRLEILRGNKPKIYVQEKVPLKKAIEYTNGVMDLYEEALKKGLAGTNEPELLNFQVGFIAGLFDDDEVTKELLFDELDTQERKMVEEVILYRVLGNPREEQDKETVPKGKKKKKD